MNRAGGTSSVCSQKSFREALAGEKGALGAGLTCPRSLVHSKLESGRTESGFRGLVPDLVGELVGRQIAQRAVRASPIVVESPRLDDATGLAQIDEPMLVQTLIPEPPVERLDEGVLDRLAGI